MRVFAAHPSSNSVIVEVAKILKVSKGTVYAMCDRGELPYRKLGNRRRIPGWLLIDWLNGKTSEGDE